MYVHPKTQFRSSRNRRQTSFFFRVLTPVYSRDIFVIQESEKSFFTSVSLSLNIHPPHLPIIIHGYLHENEEERNRRKREKKRKKRSASHGSIRVRPSELLKFSIMNERKKEERKKRGKKRERERKDVIGCDRKEGSFVGFTRTATPPMLLR